MNFQEWLIQEELSSKYIVAYHRTRKEDNIKTIASQGFFLNEGSHGNGIYFTTDYESSNKSNNIINYGEFLIKSKVSLNNVIDVTKTSEEIKNDLLAITAKTKLADLLFEDIKNIFKFGIEPTILSPDSVERLKKYVAGVKYQNMRDGNCLIIYRKENAIPIQFAHVPSPTSEKNILWQSILDLKTAYKFTKKQVGSSGDLSFGLKNKMKDLADNYNLTIKSMIPNSKGLNVCLVFVSTPHGNGQIDPNKSKEYANFLNKTIKNSSFELMHDNYYEITACKDFFVKNDEALEEEFRIWYDNISQIMKQIPRYKQPQKNISFFSKLFGQKQSPQIFRQETL